MMEIGIDSFASANSIDGIDDNITNMNSIEELLERIEYADKFGLNVFGIGEHYRKEFLDSASVLILSYSANGMRTVTIFTSCWDIFLNPSLVHTDFIRMYAFIIHV